VRLRAPRLRWCLPSTGTQALLTPYWRSSLHRWMGRLEDARSCSRTTRCGFEVLAVVLCRRVATTWAQSARRRVGNETVPRFGAAQRPYEVRQDKVTHTLGSRFLPCLYLRRVLYIRDIPMDAYNACY